MGDNMKHEIDLKMYQIRTDLAIDIIDNEKTSNGIKTKKRAVGDILVTDVIIEKKASEVLNKKPGNYVTIEFKDVTDYSNRKMVTDVFKEELNKLLNKNHIKKEDSCLVVGLGNIASTPDSLGPKVTKEIIVTNHLFNYGEVEEGFRKTFAFTPGVMGSTGIETSDMIKSLVDTINPNFIIVVDALASQSIERVNKTIQMTDTGIHPGSGVGNSRKEISFDTLNIPVIAVGVPTVVDAVTIVSDTINYMFKHYAYNRKNMNSPLNKLIPASSRNYLKEEVELKKEDKISLLGLIGSLEDEEMKQLIFEVLTPVGYNLMVTPKEVDFMIEKLKVIISNGINSALHDKIDFLEND